ncbi:MAG TPA: hypothetical protein VNO35_35570 [Steroidobacteraceae bacterium]|nr:hypothetical protein [Steroidobacteraceae bacterium]
MSTRAARNRTSDSREYRSSTPIAGAIIRYLQIKRALGCRFNTEERSLNLFGRFLAEHRVTLASQVTDKWVDRFLASRPCLEPQSFNQLLGCVRRLFEWLVDQDEIRVSPVRTPTRRVTGRRLPYLFDPQALHELIGLAEHLQDRSRCPQRGPTQAMIFAILATLGLRIGEVSRLTCGDIDLDRDSESAVGAFCAAVAECDFNGGPL